jgi:hypothetical protein
MSFRRPSRCWTPYRVCRCGSWPTEAPPAIPSASPCGREVRPGDPGQAQRGTCRLSGLGVQQPQHGRDGLVTTDKFCLSRFGWLKLSWWRFPLRLRAQPQRNCPSPQEVSAAGGSDAAVAGASGFAAPPGRAAALGQDLSAAHGLDPNTTKQRSGSGRPRASSRGG